MIKKTLLLLTLLVSVVTGMLADTATITFSSTTNDSNTPYTSTSGNNNFVSSGIASSSDAFGTISCEATSNCYKGKTGYGVKMGSSSNAGSFTLSFSSALTNVTGITLNCATYASKKGGNTTYTASTITVTNGDTQLGTITTSSISGDLSDGTISGLNISSLSTLTVSASSRCYIASITITYTAKTLSSLAITGTTPTKTTYEAGEAFDPTGLVVTGTYTDGTNTTTETITDGITWEFDYGTGNTALVAGETSVDVMAGIGSVLSDVTTISGLTVHASNKQVIYAKENNPYPYRIPALAQNKDGKLIAIADNRPSGVDIGNGEVDLVAKLSGDNGTTWPATSTTFADGDGGKDSGSYGYGDAAVVADRESNKVLAVSCYAEKGNNFWSGALASASMLSEDGGSTWGDPTTISASDKATLIGVTGAGAFFTSGRILQSQYTKVGSYYRIYSTLCATTSATTTSNPKYNTSTWVVYSDDFGSTWKVLGGTSAAPVVNGNEAKVEELPDGRIVVSSRVNDNAGASTGNSGRYFNIFTYTNTADAEGSWGTAVKNTTIAANDGQGTNGEILIVPAKDASNNDVYVALQTAPEGGTEGNRSHVSVYYKVLDAYANFKDVSTFATGWTLSKELSSTTSAYSTMILQQDGNIGLLYEENSYNGGYDIIYNKFALSELAAGYTLNTSIDRPTFVTNYFTAYEATQTSWGTDVKAEFEDLVAALADGITTAELDAIYSFIANPYVNFDGKVVVLKCVGNTAGSDAKNSDNSDKLFKKYVYNNSDAIGVTADAPTNQRSYDFVMHAGENGGYTFQSCSNTSYSLGLDSNDHLCLSLTAQEFSLTKWSDMSGAIAQNTSTAKMMDGYALQSKRVNTTGNDSILVAISSAGAIDRVNYTSQSYGSSYFTTDFTLEIVGYMLDATKDYGITDKTSFAAGDKDIVVFKRSFTKEQWTTLALPFSVTLAQLNNTFTNASVCELASITRMDIEGGKIYYRTQDHLDANVPVLAYITPNANDIYVFEDVTVENPTDDQLKYSTTPDVQLVPVYDKTYYTAYESIQNNLWFLNGGQFYDWSYLEYMNPFQAYIYNTTARSTTPNAKSFTFVPEGDVETSISGAVISMPESSTNNAIYNIAGQRVNSNAKGLLIKNGKKIFVK